MGLRTLVMAVVLMAVLAGIGTAGVPGSSIPLIVMVLVSVGIPEEGIGIILGVDRLLDMCRTVLNVTGDIAIAACVDRAEGRVAGAANAAAATPSQSAGLGFDIRAQIVWTLRAMPSISSDTAASRETRTAPL
jgi:Na+/H+-dicarboxylate symporter